MTCARSLAAAAFVLFAACTEDEPERVVPEGEGRYTVNWIIQLLLGQGPGFDSSCAAEAIREVRVVTTNVDTGDVDTVTVPCADRTATTGSIRLGSHSIELTAIGELGEDAGTATLMAENLVPDLVLDLPLEGLVTRRGEILATWLIRRNNGQEVACSDVADFVDISAWNDAVQQGTSVGGISCGETSWRFELHPPAVYEVQMIAARNAGTIVGQSANVDVQPFRGVVPREFTIFVP